MVLKSKFKMYKITKRRKRNIKKSMMCGKVAKPDQCLGYFWDRITWVAWGCFCKLLKWNSTFWHQWSLFANSIHSKQLWIKKFHYHLFPKFLFSCYWHHNPNQIGVVQLMSSNISSNSGLENDEKSFGFTTLEGIKPLSLF